MVVPSVDLYATCISCANPQLPLREEFLSLGIEAVIRDKQKSKLQPEEVNLIDEKEVLSALCNNGPSYGYEDRENLEEWEDISIKDRRDEGENNSWDGTASGTEKWKAQLTETVEKGVDHCTAAMMDICTRTFPSASLEQESIGEDNESRLGKIIAILSIPLAYFKTRKRSSVTTESDKRYRSKAVEQKLSTKGSATLYAVEATSRDRATDNKGSVRQQKREKEKRKGKLYSSSNRALQSSKSSMLFDTCADSYATPDEIAMILLAEPNSIKFLSTGGRNPLHAVCLRTPAMQIRQPLNERQGTTTRGGLCDTSDILVILHLLLNEYPEAAMQLDFSGDLAMHHLARQLWRLEREWSARAQQEEIKSNRVPIRPYANILPCFITIMKCTEAVLKPLGNARALCQEKGSVGTLLPLHAGCLNGISFDVLLSLLEGFPEAAKIPCSNALPGIKDALPLELFESRRPNAWVLERFQMKQLNSATFMQEFDRCSDLIFAYNPNILPYRREDVRLDRIKKTIVRDAQSAEPLSYTTQMLWMWLCTFSSKEDIGDNYSRCVRNILSDLNSDAIDKLIAVKSIETGERVLDIANPTCAKVLQEFIRGNIACEDVSLKQLLIKPRYYTTIGSLCRAIFGVKATYMPTNYIILPYKVTYREDNTLTLVSKDDLQIAINFASFVSHIYTADEIFSTIVTKSIESISENDSSFHSLEDSVNTKTNSLLKMYSNKRGFLYLLDEATGNPVLPKDNQIYPIEIEMDSSHARNLLRLMQMGMQLMKGKPCLPVLGRVLAKGPFPNVSDVWYDASASVLSMLNETAEKNDDLQRDLRRGIGLRHLRSPNYTAPVGVDSWKDEISSLRELLQKFDPQHSYSGLRRVSNDNSPTYWTVDASAKNTDAVLEQEKADADFGDFEKQKFGRRVCTLETTASSRLVPEIGREEPTEVRPLTCKSNDGVTTSTDEECISYTAVVDRERFYEESLSYQMSNLGNAESLSKLYAPQQIDSITSHPWVGTEINIDESLSFFGSVSDMASVSSSSTISTRYVAQLVADMDERRRDDIHALRMPLRKCEPDVNSMCSVSNDRRSRLIDRNAEIVDELRAAVIAISEDEERLRQGIKELKVALFQHPEPDLTLVQGGIHKKGIQKQDKVLVAPKHKTDEGSERLRRSAKTFSSGGYRNDIAPHTVQRNGRQILDELRAVTNSAIEEEAKLRQSLQDLKVDVYQESLKCRHSGIQEKSYHRQINAEDLGGNKPIGKPRLISETSEEEEETALWQETGNIDELKTALRASEEQERALLHEALTMLELKLALEAAEEEEKALREEAAMLQLKAALEAAHKEERALWWERDGLNLAMGRLVEEI